MGGDGLLSMSVEVITPAGFNGGGSGWMCRAFAIGETGDWRGRTLVIAAVAGDQTVTVDEDLDGPAAPTEMQLRASQVEGIPVGMHTFVAPEPHVRGGFVAVTEPDGTPSECVQWTPSTTVP